MLIEGNNPFFMFTMFLALSLPEAITLTLMKLYMDKVKVHMDTCMCIKQGCTVK